MIHFQPWETFFGGKVIREHGEDAAIEAAKMMDALLAKGDLDGQRVRRRILAAIDGLQAKERACGGYGELSVCRVALMAVNSHSKKIVPRRDQD